MIELKNVKKTYISKSKTITTALDDVSFQLPNKGLTFILGKSGCGKSTLLNLIGGLDTVTSGSIIVNNKDITTLTEKEYDSYRNSVVSIVFQEFNLLDEYNVYENIALAKELQDKEVTKDEVLALLKKVNLEGLEERKINELSGGQKQRVAIARALIKKPTILLADEPTGNLDSESSKQIFEILKEISKSILVIIVSHDTESAEHYSDNIIKIQDGKLIENSIGEIENDNTKLEFISSKLPFKYIGKIAKKSMFAKPMRLFMTILITSLSLLFMGIGINATLYNQKNLVYDTMTKYDEYEFSVNKMAKKYDQFAGLDLTEKDMQKIADIIGGKDHINEKYNLYLNNSMQPFRFKFNDDEHIKKMENDINKGHLYYFAIQPIGMEVVELSDDRLAEDVIGKIPSNTNEILVHKYFAEYVIEFGIYDSIGEIYQPKDFNSIIEDKRPLNIGEYEVYISGIIDDDNTEYQEDFKRGYFKDERLHERFNELYAFKGYRIYVKGFVENFIGSTDPEDVVNRIYLGNYDMYKPTLFKEPVNVITKDGEKEITSLTKEEVILNIEDLKKVNYLFSTKLNEYAEQHKELSLNEIEKQFTQQFLSDEKNNLTTYVWLGSEILCEAKVVGITKDNKTYISYDYTENYEAFSKSKNGFIIYENDKKKLREIIDTLEVYDENLPDGKYLMMVSPFNWEIEEVSMIHKAIGYIILAATLVFTMFTIFIFTNFISVTITYSRKKIGILKAIGASSKDILKIFGYESALVAVISWAIGVITVFIGSELINYGLRDYFPIDISVIINHPFMPVILLLHTLIISLFITAISISYINRVKPIDSILEK